MLKDLIDNLRYEYMEMIIMQSRYSRQVILQNIGEEGQKKLLN